MKLSHLMYPRGTYSYFSPPSRFDILFCSIHHLLSFSKVPSISDRLIKMLSDRLPKQTWKQGKCFGCHNDNVINNWTLFHFLITAFFLVYLLANVACFSVPFFSLLFSSMFLASFLLCLFGFHFFSFLICCSFPLSSFILTLIPPPILAIPLPSFSLFPFFFLVFSFSPSLLFPLWRQHIEYHLGPEHQS